jgi:hypothetical protein
MRTKTWGRIFILDNCGPSPNRKTDGNVIIREFKYLLICEGKIEEGSKGIENSLRADARASSGNIFSYLPPELSCG